MEGPRIGSLGILFGGEKAGKEKKPRREGEGN